MAHVPSWLEGPQDAVESLIAPAASRFHDLGLRATHLSLAQAPLVVAAGALIVDERLTWAFGVLLASLVLDLADGLYARATGTVSRLGHVLDKAMDLVGIAVFVLAVAWIRPALIVPLGIAGIASGILYGVGWFYDPELVTGVRAAGLVWLLWPVSLLLWLPAIAGAVQVPYALLARRPKDHR